MVEFLDKPSQQSLVRPTATAQRDLEQKGLMWLLDEEAIYPGSNDETFLQRLFELYDVRKKDPYELLAEVEDSNMIMLNHCLGTYPVIYNVVGWLKYSRENAVAKNVLPSLQESQRENINQLFSTMRSSMPTTFSGSIVGMEGTSSLRRTSSMRRTFATGGASLKRRSIPVQVKYQVDSIVEQLRRTGMHFVHCVLPQHNAGLYDIKSTLGTPKDDMMINVPFVRQQLRGSEILEAVRIHRQGFPEFMPYADFRRRFDMLSPVPLQTNGVIDERQMSMQLLDLLEVDKNTYRLGLSQVFFRSGGLAQLEDLRDEKIAGFIIRFQSHCRRYVAQQNLKKIKVQHLAVSCIQRNVKKFMAIRDWPWWRLYTKVQPLLNVHRTEEELKNKDIELEQLRSKVEKLEKERLDYKQACDKLESKLSDVSADLMEEHTTSSQASEMLEAETSERMRLEKELRDLQVKLNGLGRKNEQLEMQVMQTNLWRTSIDGQLEEDEDEADGDSIYQQKYERARRETEFVKRQLQQQHAEEIEMEKSSKKHLEKRLNEVMEENEDQRKQLITQRRKVQKLQSDMQDHQLHLEEQLMRNNELEKKQRRFDAELNHYQEEANDEHRERERLQRERDTLSAEKYTLTMERDQIQQEYDLQGHKLKMLQDELNDMDNVGNKDDKEVLALKRQIREIEIKVNDQEEELDEQAGTILQLEQAKLRLEMEHEKLRQSNTKELEDKEIELEELRYSTQKKVKNMEVQIEDEYEEKQKAIREKRELERQLQELSNRSPQRDRVAEKTLRRDLKRTKALLRDAQTMLDRQKDPTINRNVIKQLRNQLEDAEFAAAAAVKARKGIEMEIQDLHQQFDDISKGKQEAEERVLQLTREKNDLQNKLDEHEDEIAEIIKKYKAVVQQQSVDQITLNDQSVQISDLTARNEILAEQVSGLQTRVAYLEADYVDKQTLLRGESKLRETDTKLEYERTLRERLEGQIERLKETIDQSQTTIDDLHAKDQRHQEVNKRQQRQLRDLHEEFAELQTKEGESCQRKHDLEMKAESVEADLEQCQSDLKLAFKRIADLQAALEDDIDSDSDFMDSDEDIYDDIDGETDDTDMDTSLEKRGSYGDYNEVSSLKSGAS